MRIILSRKGVDSGAGRIASPILKGSLVSLPIPLSSQITYGDLKFGRISLGTLAEDLSKGGLRASSEVHLDPDLRRGTYPRKPGWRPIFGQGEPRAESHLQSFGVTVGDLFLFYGWFREVTLRDDGKYHYVKRALHRHVIYGWLQVGAIVSCDDPQLSDFHWARYHPHFRGRDGTAYISSRTLHIGRDLDISGGGCFTRYHDGLRLTAPDSEHRRVWQLPRWFYPRDGCFPITYHPDKTSFSRRGNHSIVHSAARGQEFILDSREYPEAVSWARRLIVKATNAT